jgi:hypothetical protein
MRSGLLKSSLIREELKVDDYEYIFVYMRGTETCQLPSPPVSEKKLTVRNILFGVTKFSVLKYIGL